MNDAKDKAQTGPELPEPIPGFENFDAFKERYLGELNASDAAHACARQLKKDAAKAGGTITLLYAARDPKINHAVILKGWLEEQMK